MSPEAQRIAIAESLGWRNVTDGWADKQLFGYAPGTTGYVTRVPEYVSDLNAMHEAEKSLIDISLNSIFATSLQHELGPMGAIHATAAQRAKAFLRTIEKWTA